MTLKNLIDAHILGGSQFELIDSETLEEIDHVYNASFHSFRTIGKSTLSREVACVYGQCPEYIHNCFGQRYKNESRSTVIVVMLDPLED